MIRLGLKTKLLTFVVSLIVVMGSTIIYYVRDKLDTELMSELRKRGTIIAQDIGERTTTFMLMDNKYALQTAALDAVEKYEEVEYVYFTDRNSQVMTHSFELVFPTDLLRMEQAAKFNTIKITTLETNIGRLFNIGLPILNGDIGMVHVGIKGETTRRYAHAITYRLMLVITAILVISLLVVTIMVSFVTQPIAQLTKAAEDISQGGRGEWIEANSHDEVGRLAQAFNLMADSLDQAQKRLQEANATLEERVQARTSRLREIAGKLRYEIQERKKTDEALFKLHQRNEMILNSAGEGIYGIDLEGTIIFINPIAAKFVGWSAEALVGQENHSLLHARFLSQQQTPSAAQEEPQNLKFLLDGQIHRVENRWFRHKKGFAFPVEYTCTPILEDDIVTGAVVTFRDVTEKRKIESALLESEARYRSIVEEVPTSIVLVGESGQVLDVNPYYLDHIGDGRLTRHRFMGQNILQFSGIREAGLVSFYEQVLAGEQGFLEEKYLPLRNDTGQQGGFFNIKGVPITKKGKNRGALFLHEDITSVKRSEDINARLGRTIERSINEIFVFEANSLRFVQVNQGARENLGYCIEELTTLTPMDIKPEFTRESFEALLQPLRTGQEEQVVLETRHQRKDGSFYEVDTRLQLMKDEVPAVFVSIVMDVTERKREAAKIKQYQTDLETMVAVRTADLSQANKDLKDFTYIVSHDLRSPLVSIQGLAGELRLSMEDLQEILSPHTANFPEEEQEEVSLIIDEDIPQSLRFMEASVEKMDRLVNSILKLSRLGRRDIQATAVDIRDVIATDIQNIAYSIDKNDITVRLGTLPSIVSDKTALEQIFGNLLSNAVKYIKPGQPGLIEITAEENKDRVIFKVRDEGRGIASDDISRIFKIFQRVGEQDTKGEGMGLAYVQALVRRLGGKIWCESEEGVGTKFFISLPQRPESTPKQKDQV